MKRQLFVTALLALLLAPAAAFAQGTGSIELGFGGITGTVDNRTAPGQAPYTNGFKPEIANVGVNTYDDFRNRLAIPKLAIEKALANNQYFNFEAVNTGAAFDGGAAVRNQSFLASVARPGSYKVQFAFDETPHLFSGTTRSLYRETSPGVWQFTGNRAVLDGARVLGTGAALNTAGAAVMAGAPLDVQQGTRKLGAGRATFNLNPNWNVALGFSRENQSGNRPLGMCFGNNPSCFWSEIPENLDYKTSTFTAGTEYGQKTYDVALGYWRQNFENTVASMTVDNPFSNNANSETVTGIGQMGLYPSNDAQNLQFAGAINRGALHLMTSISPGWMSQNDPFVPYTTNTFLLNRTGAAAPIPLPVNSLDGERKTLMMNYTASYKPAKAVEVSAKYRQYDFNNHTEEHTWNPWVNDLAAEAQLAGPSGQEVKEFGGLGGVLAACKGVCNEPLSFSTKNVDLGATWFFAGRNSAKLQYGREIFDREERDVSQSIEDIVKFAVDLKPTTDFTLRVTTAHQDRKPQDAEYEWFLIPGTQRFDEGFRLRNRVDLLATYDLTDRVSVSGFFGNRNDDFNRQDALTSTTPLGDPAKITRLAGVAAPSSLIGNYYIYGVLNDKNRNYGGDFDVLVAENVTFFAEYARERNTMQQVSRVRSANTASQVGCPSTTLPQDCDPINDWTTSTKDLIDTYSAGLDLSLPKKIDFSLSYSRSSANGHMLTDGVFCQVGNVGNPACRTQFPNWRIDSAASPALTLNFPDTSSKLQAFDLVARLRVSDSLRPKFKYRYQKFDYNDFQTSVLNPWSYVGAGPDPGGSTGLQRMIFLGADTPGYNAHIFSVTLEYRF